MEYVDNKQELKRKLSIQRKQDDWENVHNQLMEVQEQKRIQKKALEISNPGDTDEKEADEVARKIMSGESAEIHGTGSTISRKGEGSAETTDEFQSKLESNKGNGQPLDDSTRSEMESKMGADLSGVKIHTGSEAHSMSESINAKAFTHGQDIYFHGGHSPQNKELLAHELVHTVQQKNAPQQQVQRTVIVGGSEKKFSESELSSSETLRKMNASSQEFRFKDEKELREAVTQRGKLGEIILDAASGKYSDSVSFAQEDTGFSLPENYWVQKGDSFTLMPGQEPAAAVNAIFNNGRQLSSLDCNMMMVSAHYYSILLAKQKMVDSKENNDEFNALFPEGKGLTISQVTAGEDNHPFKTQKVLAQYTTEDLRIVIDPADPGKDLVPGDWVYFSNVSDKSGDDKWGYRGMLDAANKMMNEFVTNGAGYGLREELNRLVPEGRSGELGMAYKWREACYINYMKKKKYLEKETKIKKKDKKDLEELEEKYTKAETDLNKLQEKTDNLNARLHPAPFSSNAWQGEHAVYLGNNRFAGFGMSAKDNEQQDPSVKGRSYQSILDELFLRYTEVINAYYDHEAWSGDEAEKNLMKNMTINSLRSELNGPHLSQVKRFDYGKISELGK